MASLEIFKKTLPGQLLLTSTMITSGAIVNFLQLLLNITVKPWNKALFDKLMFYVNYGWICRKSKISPAIAGIFLFSKSHLYASFFVESVFVLDNWSGTEIILYCRPEVREQFGKKHHLILMNHTYEIDWLITFGLLDKFNLLSFVKAFAKNAIKFIPFFGWFFGLSEQIFLQRSYEKDKKVIDEAFSSFLRYPSSVCIMMPAEGTRFTREKHETSMDFAKKNNIALLKHHLIPRARGFLSCVPALKENSEIISVLNMQIVFDPKAINEPKLINIIRGKPVTAHVYLDIVPNNEITATNESLMKVYQQKDALHDSFLKYGNFHEGRNVAPIEGIKLEKQQRPLIVFLFWLVVNVLVMINFSLWMFQNGYLITFMLISAVSIGIGEFIALYLIEILILTLSTLSINYSIWRHATDSSLFNFKERI